MADLQLPDTLPTQLNPLFTAQQVVCAYPISDIYASFPRYFYYALLVVVILVRTRSWVANVFLGAAATYAGTAAIEAFVLISHRSKIRNDQTVSIPYVDSSSVDGNATLSDLPNLVTDLSSVTISPGVMEFDIDAILAIVITGYLTMLPMHCWSDTVRIYRARHIIIGLWNALMLAGSICALILWPSISWDSFKVQYRFCYPQYPDDESTTNDGWTDSLWQGDWNSTVWHTFSNLTANFLLPQNCLYPCFNTSAVMRQVTSITASLDVDKNPRTNINLTDRQYAHYDHLTNFMYAAIALSTLMALVFLLLNVTNLRITRVPIHRPKLLWSARTELWHSFTTDTMSIFGKDPKSGRITWSERLSALFRLLIDLSALLMLVAATILIPVTNIVFIVWIEWFIHRDLVSKESFYQVGQWSSLAAISLVLISAVVLRFRYRVASEEELFVEANRCRDEVQRLETLIEMKQHPSTAAT